jgi:hypothetical protein
MKSRILWLALTLQALMLSMVSAQDDSASTTVPRQPVPQQAVAGGPFPIAVIYTNIPGDPSAAVPSLPGASFGPGMGTTHFDRVFGSPNGNWILTADTDLPTTMDEVVLVNDTLGVQEGTPASWTGGTESVGLIDSKVGINDSGAWVFATNTDGLTTADEYLVSVSGGVLSAAAQEGDPTPLAGTTWGSTLESAVLTSGGTLGLVSDSVGGGIPTTEDEILVLGSTVLAQEGVTVPTAQLEGEFWENFDLDDFWVSTDGSSWLVQGDLTGSTTTDDVVVVNGAVVVQEGVILPGSGFSEAVDDSGIVAVHMAPDGRWFVRGNNAATELDWIYSDGVVIARGGDPITTGSAELWNDADFFDLFFLHVGNSNGDFVLGGVTDAVSSANGILVLNNSTVVVRESDPIDLDGNGSFDDDTFFDTFGNDDAFLSDAGLLYIVATIKNATGTRLGQGFFEIDLTSEVPVELMGFSVD